MPASCPPDDVPERVADEKRRPDIDPPALKLGQGLANNGRLGGGRVGGRSRDHVKDIGETQVLHLRQGHGGLLRRGRCEGNAALVQVTQQLRHARERHRVQVVIRIPAPVPGDQIRQEVTGIPQVRKGMPQGRTHVAAEPTVIGDR